MTTELETEPKTETTKRKRRRRRRKRKCTNKQVTLNDNVQFMHAYVNGEMWCLGLINEQTGESFCVSQKEFNASTNTATTKKQ